MNSIGKYVLYSAIVMPVALWLLTDIESAKIHSSGDMFKVLAKSSALIGMSAYALMPLLSMRHPKLERFFGSLDRIYDLHKSISKRAIIAISLHPLLLVGAALADRHHYGAIWSWSSIVLWSGVATYLVILAVLAVTIYARVTHQQWIFVHRLFGWMIVPVYIHALLAGQQVASNPALLTYMLIIGAIGLAAFAYRSIFAAFFVKRYQYIVAEVNHITETITELTLKPAGLLPMTYNAGQFAYLSLDAGTIDKEAHPFSFVTAPNGPYIRFAIKNLGDYTHDVGSVTPGATALLEGPYGDFSRGIGHKKSQIWIAGGIGITPFMSMARSIQDRDVDIALLYCVKTMDDAAYADELKAISEQTRGTFRVMFVAEDRYGYLTMDTIKNALPNKWQAADYFICGPPGMHTALSAGLKHAGVSQDNIHLEEFSLH